jgi:hypothetical protein
LLKNHPLYLLLSGPPSLLFDYCGRERMKVMKKFEAKALRVTRENDEI